MRQESAHLFILLPSLYVGIYSLFSFLYISILLILLKKRSLVTQVYLQTLNEILTYIRIEERRKKGIGNREARSPKRLPKREESLLYRQFRDKLIE